MTKISKIKKPKKPTSKQNKQNHSKKSFRTSRIRFLPAALIALFASFLWLQPNLSINRNNDGDVLAYATNTSTSGLLTSTNSQRNSNGAANLGLNTKLNSAAQAKANDMVARNYWSHQTPDGQQPWVFIDNAGYKYLAAGENLAYGFSNSDTTVTGWMNSPSHKANLLNTAYTEVGFGIANSADYINNGNQTVVVAMYGKPQGSETPAEVKNESTTTVTPQQKQKSTPKQTATPTPEPIQNPQVSNIPETPTDSQESGDSNQMSPITHQASNPIQEVSNPEKSEQTKEINRIQILTGGNAIWSTSLVILLVCSIGVLWGLHRGYRLSQIIKNSGQAIGKNIHIDLAVLALIFLAYVLMSTSGFIV